MENILSGMPGIRGSTELALGLPGAKVIDPVDGDDITDLVLAELKQLVIERDQNAARQQIAAVEAGILNTRAELAPGIPAPSLRIAPAVYWHWYRRENLLNNQAGKSPINPWKHAEFRRDLARDNPEIVTRPQKDMSTVHMISPE